MAEGWCTWHWTVDDESFTDRWEVESPDGLLYGWVDRVVDERGAERFECSVAVDGRRAFDTRDGALDALLAELGLDGG